MNPDYYGLIEMGLSFALIIGFGVWQLISLERVKKRSREKAAAEARREK